MSLSLFERVSVPGTCTISTLSLGPGRHEQNTMIYRTCVFLVDGPKSRTEDSFKEIVRLGGVKEIDILPLLRMVYLTTFLIYDVHFHDLFLGYWSLSFIPEGRHGHHSRRP